MRFKKWIVGIVLLLTISSTIYAQRYENERNFTVTQSDNGVIITGYTGRNKNIRIPPQIQEMPVVGIGGGAFREKQLRSITIPDSVVSIGNNAFRENRLTSVTIGNNVTTIGASAFYQNQLTSVVIPDSIISIGNHAFRENQLTSVIIGNNVTTIGASAFSQNQLTSVVIPDSVVSIGNDAFRENRLTSLTIGNGVTSIGNQVFLINQLTSVVIPDSVTTIGNQAFANNPQLTSISLPFNIPRAGQNAYGNAKTTRRVDTNIPEQRAVLVQQEAQKLGFNVSVSNKNEITITGYTGRNTSIQIPAQIYGAPVIKIGNDAFKNKRLTSVTIPNSVTAIGNQAFEQNQLTSITIPESVSEIGNRAFANNQLTSLIIPNSVKTVGSGAFAQNQLTGVTMPDNITFTGEAFSNNPFYVQQQEEERLAQLQQTRDQIMRMVRLDGAYFNTREQTVGHGGPLPNKHVYAIRFVNLNLDRNNVGAHVFFNDGYGKDSVLYLRCFLEGSSLYYMDRGFSLLYSSENNRNILQARTESGNPVTLQFRPHPPSVTGKTFRWLNDNRFFYSFTGSNYTSQILNSQTNRVETSRGQDDTYTYSEGVITLMYRGIETGVRLYVAGPLLTGIAGGGIYVEEQ